jgi:hypothetical protein
MLFASVHAVKLPKVQRMQMSGSNKGLEMFPVPMKDLDQDLRS